MWLRNFPFEVDWIGVEEMDIKKEREKLIKESDGRRKGSLKRIEES